MDVAALKFTIFIIFMPMIKKIFFMASSDNHLGLDGYNFYYFRKEQVDNRENI